MQKSTEEAGFLCVKHLEFALVQPHAFTVEALIDADVTESYLLELHATFWAFHEMKFALTLAFLYQNRCLTLLGDKAPSLCFLPCEVFLFIAARLFIHVVRASLGRV
jgi:hypothetical protein